MTLVVVLSLAPGCERKRTPSVYEIPEGYRGWVTIDFGVPSCPPLSLRDGKYIVVIQASGKACTSSAPEYGYARDEFYFVGRRRAPIAETHEGQGGLIWGGGMAGLGPAGKQRIIGHFFVGSEADYRSAKPFYKAAEDGQARKSS